MHSTRPLGMIRGLSTRPVCGTLLPKFSPLICKKSLTNLNQRTSPKRPEDIAQRLHPRELRKEKIWTLPNALTFTRLGLAPVIGYLICGGHHNWALGLFTYSCVTDFLDGWIARRYNLRSRMGSIIDPMADKLLMITFTSCLAYTHAVPGWIAAIILGRDLFLGLSAFYIRYISLPPPKTFARYWDMSIPSVEVFPSTVSKYNTFFQMVYLGLSFIAQTPYSPVVLPEICSYLGYLVAFTTTWSGLDYVVRRDAVRFIK